MSCDLAGGDKVKQERGASIETIALTTQEVR